MRKYLQLIGTEMAWILGTLVACFMISYYLFGNSIFEPELDVHLSDTYLIISKSLILAPLCLFLLFIVYSLRTYRRRFQLDLENWILVIVGIALQVCFLNLSNTLSEFALIGWTSYPPLSALQEPVTPVNKDSSIVTIIRLLNAIQAVCLMSLLFSCFRWGVVSVRRRIAR